MFLLNTKVARSFLSPNRCVANIWEPLLTTVKAGSCGGWSVIFFSVHFPGISHWYIPLNIFPGGHLTPWTHFPNFIYSAERFPRWTFDPLDILCTFSSLHIFLCTFFPVDIRPPGYTLYIFLTAHTPLNAFPGGHSIPRTYSTALTTKH